MKKTAIATVAALLLTGILTAGEPIAVNTSFQLKNGKIDGWKINEVCKKQDGTPTGKVSVETKDGKNILHFEVSGGRESHFYSARFPVNENDMIVTKVTAYGTGTLRVSFFCYNAETKFLTILQSKRVYLTEQPQTFEFKTKIKSPADAQITQASLVLMCDSDTDIRISSLESTLEKAAQ